MALKRWTNACAASSVAHFDVTVLWRNTDVGDTYATPVVGQLTDDDFTKLDEEVKAVVQDAWDFADQSPEPPLEALYEDVLVDTTSDTHAEAAVAAD